MLSIITLLTVLVMSILVTRKNGTYIGGPMGSTKLLPYDTVMLYGQTSAVQKLDERKRGQTGDEEHVREVVRQDGGGAGSGGR